MGMVDIILIVVYLMLAAAVGVLIFSVVRSGSMGGKSFMVVNGIPVGKIFAAITVVQVAVLALTFALGSDIALSVNGKTYSEWFWLKTADMFIYTSALMLIVASALVVYGLVRRNGNVRT